MLNILNRDSKNFSGSVKGVFYLNYSQPPNTAVGFKSTAIDQWTDKTF